ncbi:MAG: SigB/SigF/SigG family RNA polymerase sigma factor [Acidimicrobiia bacterium]|nr:SigB/SigF/SigG family RNA polymerase sigma factor [Acidimicrobiia bacterium]
MSMQPGCVGGKTMTNASAALVRRRPRRPGLGAGVRSAPGDPGDPGDPGQLHRQYLRTRDPALAQVLVEMHTGLAHRLAARFANRGEAPEDLTQVAMLGLVKALDGFDPDRGLRFSTYATPTILGELKRHFRDRGWAVRLPRRVHDLYLNVQHAIDELAQELQRSPTLEEIACRVGAPVENVVEAVEAGGLRRSASIDARLGPDDDRSVASSLGDDDPALAGVDRRLTLAAVVQRLPEVEQEIVRLRFVEGLTQLEIAQRVGRSQMQISRLLARSLDRLRGWVSEAPAS